MDVVVFLDTASCLSELKEKSDRRTEVEKEKKHTVNLAITSICTFSWNALGGRRIFMCRLD